MRPFLVLFVTVAACAATIRQEQEETMHALTRRASFDLSCPEQQLQVTCLQTGPYECAMAGVTACGNRAVYVYTFVEGAGMQWVMNSSDGQPRQSAGPPGA